MEAITIQSLLSVGISALVVNIVVQLVKQWLPEAYVRLFAILFGIVLVVAAALVLGQRTAADLGNAVLTGFLGGSSAIGLYALQEPVHLLGSKPEE